MTDGGFSVTLRDLGRFGLMHLQNGAIAGRQVVPAEWIGRLLRPVPALSAAFGGALEVPGMTGPDTMYHDQWWVLDPTLGIYVGVGIHGQILLIHRPSQGRWIAGCSATRWLAPKRSATPSRMARSSRAVIPFLDRR